MIAFYGMGLLGSNFVRALRHRGEAVRVWNRNPERARPLAADGAIVVEDPAVAARGATQIHLTLSDDAAVDGVLERIFTGLEPGAVIVDHTTTSPAGTLVRAKRWAERGFPFLHAPVFMGPQNALESSGAMLASGDRALYDRLAPDLAKMTGRLVYLGPEPERAAAFKLLGNAFLMFITAGCADVLALGKAFGLKPADVATLFQFFNPAGTVPLRLERMMAQNFDSPSWELAMARKDARLMIEAAAQKEVPLAVIPTIAGEMDRFIARGHAHDDWTVIAKDSVS